MMRRRNSDSRIVHANLSLQSGTKQAKTKKIVYLALLLAFAVVFLSLSILLILEEVDATQMVPGSRVVQNQEPPLPQETQPGQESAEVLQEIPVPQPVAQPEVTQEPVGGWPPYVFTAEETAQLDTLLAEWAASEQPVVQEEPAEGEEGEVLEEPASEDPNEGHRVAVYFQDLDSGAEYIYNAQEVFDVASLSKAPYALYLYLLVEQGQASLEETFLVDAQSIEDSLENSGVLKDDPNLPREISLAEMIEYMLRYSDTAALRILLERYPADGYAAWAAEIGVPNVRSVTGDDITAQQAGAYLAALYDYMQNGQYGPQLQEHLMNTRNAMLSTSWPIARKYGWDVQAYHDMGVVYATHPYLIVILTDKSVGASEDRQYFATLPAMFEQMMNAHWSTVQERPANQKLGVE